MVHPKVPGTPQTLSQEIEQRANELAKLDIDTLLLVFSGHATKEDAIRKFILGSEEEVLSNEELFGKIQTLVNKVRKLVVLLDNCLADLSCYCHLKKPDLAYIQMNACERHQQTTLNRKTGSLFIQSFVQAFEKEAKQSPCVSNDQYCEYCKRWTENGPFIMLSELFEYLEGHVERYSEQISRNISPKLTKQNASSYDEIIAFKVSHTIKVKMLPTKPKGSSKFLRLPFEKNDNQKRVESLWEEFKGRYVL